LIPIDRVETSINIERRKDINRESSLFFIYILPVLVLFEL